MSRVSIGGTPTDIPDEEIRKQPKGQARRCSANISSSTPWLNPQHDVDPGLEHRNTVKRMAKGSIASDRRLWELASSESTDLERKNVPPPPEAGTEVRAFNATHVLPPNPTVMGNVIGERCWCPISYNYKHHFNK